MAIRQPVHRSQPDIEPVRRIVNCQDIDPPLPVVLVGERELPAGAAVRGVPACDGGSTTDVGEGGEVAKGLVAACEEAVYAVRARDGGEGTLAVVIRLVVCDRDGEGWCSESSKGSEEEHHHRCG